MTGANGKDVVLSIKTTQEFREKLGEIANTLFKGNKSWLVKDALGRNFSWYLLALEKARELKAKKELPNIFDKDLDPLTATALFIIVEVPQEKWDNLEKNLKKALEIIKEELRRTRF